MNWEHLLELRERLIRAGVADIPDPKEFYPNTPNLYPANVDRAFGIAAAIMESRAMDWLELLGYTEQAWSIRDDGSRVFVCWVLGEAKVRVEAPTRLAALVAAVEAVKEGGRRSEARNDLV